MRHLTLLAAASALTLATPAYADGHGYVGFDAGLLMPDDIDFDYDSDNVFDAELNNGFDLDLIGGYDFGFVRVEGELAWKRATIDSLTDGDEEFDADADTDVRSIMLNVLGDFGTDKWSFYAGGGVGFARVRILSRPSTFSTTTTSRSRTAALPGRALPASAIRSTRSSMSA
jgi:opacity protein-like surface antigen